MNKATRDLLFASLASQVDSEWEILPSIRSNDGAFLVLPEAKPTDTHEFEVGFFAPVETTQRFFGFNSGQQASVYYYETPDLIYAATILGSAGYKGFLLASKATTKSYKIKISPNNIYVDEVLKASIQMAQKAYKLGLFAELRLDDETGSITEVRASDGVSIPYYRRYDSVGTLTINYQPRRNITTGAIGMYDLITNTFHTNQNTVGYFSVGD